MEQQFYFKNTDIADIASEEWNDVQGYDGVYQASSLGRIKSCERVDSNGRFRHSIIRKQSITTKGMLSISLHFNGDHKCYTVQSLIFCAFNGIKSNEKIKVGHKNKVMLDNRLSNLELQSQRKVITESIRLGRLIPDSSIGQRAAKKTADAYRVFDVGPGRRICTKCFSEKPFSDFHRKPSGPQGLNRICSDCVNKADGVMDVGKNKYLKTLSDSGLKRCKKCDTVKEESKFISEKGTNYFYCLDCMRGAANGTKNKFDKLFESGLRNCTRCKIVKPFSEFNKLTSGRGGVGYVCKVCNKR